MMKSVDFQRVRGWFRCPFDFVYASSVFAFFFVSPWYFASCRHG